MIWDVREEPRCLPSPKCLYLADYSFKGAAQQTLSHSPARAQVCPGHCQQAFVTGLLWPGIQVYSSVSSAQLGTLRGAASGPSGTQPGAKLIHPNW